MSPASWLKLPLKRVAEVMPSNVDKHTVEGELPVRLCNYVDVYNNDRIDDSIDFMAATASEAQITRFTLKAQDVLVTKDSEEPSDIGVPAYVPRDMPGVVCGYHLAVLRPDLMRVHGAFLHWALQSTEVQAYYETAATGISRYALGLNDLGMTPLHLPDRPTQARIANFLDEQTARIDALIAEKERLNELLTEIIFSSAGQCLEVKKCNWSRLLHACKTASRPVDQQDGESYRRLGLFNRGRGIFIRDDTDKDDMGDSEFYWVEAGDLVISGQFAWEGAVALAAPEHSGCVVSHRFPVIRGRAGVAVTEYLFALFMTQFGEFVLNDCARGSAGRNRPLNTSLLMKWKIPIPPMAKQEEIAGLVRLREGLRKVSERSVALLREYRASLISATVTGQLDIDSFGREVA